MTLVYSNNAISCQLLRFNSLKKHFPQIYRFKRFGKKVPWFEIFFPDFGWKTPVFPWFPWLEKVFKIFPEFPDFPDRWEPWPNEKENIIIQRHQTLKTPLTIKVTKIAYRLIFYHIYNFDRFVWNLYNKLLANILQKFCNIRFNLVSTPWSS